jgi:hypothetical protein
MRNNETKPASTKYGLHEVRAHVSKEFIIQDLEVKDREDTRAMLVFVLKEMQTASKQRWKNGVEIDCARLHRMHPSGNFEAVIDELDRRMFVVKEYGQKTEAWGLFIAEPKFLN